MFGNVPSILGHRPTVLRPAGVLCFSRVAGEEFHSGTDSVLASSATIGKIVVELSETGASQHELCNFLADVDVGVKKLSSTLVVAKNLESMSQCGDKTS